MLYLVRENINFEGRDIFPGIRWSNSRFRSGFCCLTPKNPPDLSGEYVNYKEFPPKAKEHKSRITTCSVYWAISIIWTFLGDFLFELFNKIYSLFGNLYDKMAKSVFGKFDEDFK